MKKSLIIFNVLFLFIINILYSNIHHSHDHHHTHFDNHDCQECIKIENNNNYTSEFQKENFSNNSYIQIVFQKLSFIENSFDKEYNPRAPPIS